MTALPTVSVVIPTWNNARDLKRILPAILAQEGLGSFEVLVVDNGVVNDESEIVVKEFENLSLRYLRFEKQLGYAGAVNAGAKAASNSLIAVMNNDNLAEPGWLHALVHRYQKEKASGREVIVSSLVKRSDLPLPLESTMNFCGRIVSAGKPSGGEYVPFHPDGSSFLFNRDFLGLPYDEDYFIYHEDVALGWRAWLSGGENVIETSSKAITFDGGSTRRIAYRTAFYTEKNRWLNFLIFPSSLNLVRWLPLLFLDLILRILAGSNRRAKLHAIGSLLMSARVICQKRSLMQSKRKRSDAEILSLISSTYMKPNEAGAKWLNPIFRGLIKLLGLPFGR